jgi:hypothetical protein
VSALGIEHRGGAVGEEPMAPLEGWIVLLETSPAQGVKHVLTGSFVEVRQECVCEATLSTWRVYWAQGEHCRCVAGGSKSLAGVAQRGVRERNQPFETSGKN